MRSLTFCVNAAVFLPTRGRVRRGLTAEWSRWLLCQYQSVSRLLLRASRLLQLIHHGHRGHCHQVERRFIATDLESGRSVAAVRQVTPLYRLSRLWLSLQLLIRVSNWNLLASHVGRLVHVPAILSFSKIDELHAVDIQKRQRILCYSRVMTSQQARSPVMPTNWLQISPK